MVTGWEFLITDVTITAPLQQMGQKQSHDDAESSAIPGWLEIF